MTDDEAATESLPPGGSLLSGGAAVFRRRTTRRAMWSLRVGQMAVTLEKCSHSTSSSPPCTKTRSYLAELAPLRQVQVSSAAEEARGIQSSPPTSRQPSMCKRCSSPGMMLKSPARTHTPPLLGDSCWRLILSSWSCRLPDAIASRPDSAWTLDMLHSFLDTETR